MAGRSSRPCLWRRPAAACCRLAAVSPRRGSDVSLPPTTRWAYGGTIVTASPSVCASLRRSALAPFISASFHTAPVVSASATSPSTLAAAATAEATAARSSHSPAPLDTVILDGKATADRICDDMRQLLRHYQTALHTTDRPGLAVLIVGDRRDSLRYVQRKTEQADRLGFHSRLLRFAESVSTERLLAAIDELNGDGLVHGILVQLPLPAHVEQHRVLERVCIEKDVDGFHPYNMGLLALNWQGAGKFVPWEKVHRTIEKSVDEQDAVVDDVTKLFNIPCAPRACLELLKRYGISVRGKHCVVLGRSAIVGLPLSLLLLHSDATVTNCHHLTPHAQQRTLCQQADLLVSATGQPLLVRRDWVRRGAVVLDVGINFIRKRDGSGLGGAEDERAGVELVGDVDTAGLMGHAAAVTPVPGGVGPMTVAMLLENTLHNWIKAKGGDQHKGAEHKPLVR